MKQMILSDLEHYNDLRAEAQLLEQWLKTFTDTSRENRLRLLEMKLTVLNSWLLLLNDDERFVVQKHIMDKLEWGRVAHAFKSRWGKKYAHPEGVLLRYQTNALEKIENFTLMHTEIVMPLMGRNGTEGRESTC